MDKASPHYKSKKVLKYLEENKDTLIPVYLPTASPEFIIMEEIWNLAKQDILVIKYYSSFADLRKRYLYFKKKRLMILYFSIDCKDHSVCCIYTTINILALVKTNI